MRLRNALVLASVAAFAHWSALADERPRITPQAAYAKIAQKGELADVTVDGDLDAAKMQPPPDAKAIEFRRVTLNGTLSATGGGPPVALLLRMVTLNAIDFRDAHWRTPLTIETSTVNSSAQFARARFDAPLTLYKTTVDGLAGFSGARFAAPVEITYSTFKAPPPPRISSVSFADARFAGPARFDHSEFSNVLFNTARFDADASFLGLKVSDLAEWKNVIFRGDAEFRFCRLGKANFGGTEYLSVFMHLVDFRGCWMKSLVLDYADIRGDALLVNVHIAPGDLTLREASLRGACNDFSGLQVAGKIDLTDAQIANLHMRWYEIGEAVWRSKPGSAVLRPLQRRLEELKQNDEARDVSALLARREIEERLAQPKTSPGDRALLRAEQIVWGKATGYGTRLDRIVGIALLCWLLLALPLAFAGGLRIVRADTDKAPPLHTPIAPDASPVPPVSAGSRAWQALVYAFSLMFTLPDFGLRPAAPLTSGMHSYLLFMRGVGLLLIALMVLTLAKVSPIFQAVIGKIAS
jgi:uncharacterized protein YjbI with pentapeptide repeats